MFDPSFNETSFIVNELFERVLTKLKHLHYIRFAFLIVIKAEFFTNWMGKKTKQKKLTLQDNIMSKKYTYQLC